MVFVKFKKLIKRHWSCKIESLDSVDSLFGKKVYFVFGFGAFRNNGEFHFVEKGGKSSYRSVIGFSVFSGMNKTGVKFNYLERKLVETVEAIPLENIVLETDCPYMAPEPHRGSRNSSIYLKYVAEKIAQIKGVSVEDVEKITYDNALRIYSKCKRN